VNRQAAFGQYLVVAGSATDGALIGASRSDPYAFAKVFDRHFGGVHRFIARRVGSELADDLAAETFVEAFRSRGRYDPAHADARPWLYGIAVNLLRHHHRRERRRLRAYARIGVEAATDEGDLGRVEARVDADAAGPRLALALASLGPGDREVLLLFAWADLSYAEIARALGLPVGTVRSRLHRARAQIRELIGDVGATTR
jgi:RNA polymerase sigma-70 factor (ECF subfamily)